MFDAKQMLPVIPGGDHIDIVKAGMPVFITLLASVQKKYFDYQHAASSSR
jgi:hypothetical protein